MIQLYKKNNELDKKDEDIYNLNTKNTELQKLPAEQHNNKNIQFQKKSIGSKNHSSGIRAKINQMDN